VDTAELRSGFVALVGRPNVGKSTLTNALVGRKVAIVSDKPQTTRHRLRGIVDTDDAQIVLVDTPGLHKPHDALGEELNRSALLALADVDVACLLLDSTAPVGRGDAWVAAHVARASGSKVLVVTKADLAGQELVLAQLSGARELAEFDEVIVVSAVKGFNTDGLVEMLTRLLPMGPAYFPRGMGTDQALATMLAEAIREKVLLRTREEVPHSVGVAIEEIEARSDLTFVRAIVYVERDSQKGILVGKGGEMIKQIGEEARADLETILGARVYLELQVKEKHKWRSDATQIRRFGYGEGL
jgi:GTP-binding protein Era